MAPPPDGRRTRRPAAQVMVGHGASGPCGWSHPATAGGAASDSVGQPEGAGRRGGPASAGERHHRPCPRALPTVVGSGAVVPTVVAGSGAVALAEHGRRSKAAVCPAGVSVGKPCRCGCPHGPVGSPRASPAGTVAPPPRWRHRAVGFHRLRMSAIARPMRETATSPVRGRCRGWSQRRLDRKILVARPCPTLDGGATASIVDASDPVAFPLAVQRISAQQHAGPLVYDRIFPAGTGG